MAISLDTRFNRLNERLLAFHHGDRDQFIRTQFLCLAEETGEAIQAFRRWEGLARKGGKLSDLAIELCDVAIVLRCTAELLGLDLESLVQNRLTEIESRDPRGI